MRAKMRDRVHMDAAILHILVKPQSLSGFTVRQHHIFSAMLEILHRFSGERNMDCPKQKLLEFASVGTNNGLKLELDTKDNKCITITLTTTILNHR